MRIAIVALVTALLHVVAVHAGTVPDPNAPYLFERVAATVAMRTVQADGVNGRFLSRTAMSPAGDYVVLARAPSSVEVWSLKTGQKTIQLSLAKSEDRQTYAAFIGDPCVLVTGLGGAGVGSITARLGVTDRAIELWDCKSGRPIAEVRGTKKPPGMLRDLIALPSCGLVVARYSGGVQVIDVAARVVAPELGHLFEGAVGLTRGSFPKSSQPDLDVDVTPILVGEPGDGKCRVFGLRFEAEDGLKGLVPADIHEFDLTAGVARRVASVNHRLVPFGGSDFGSFGFAMSPSGRYAAVSRGEMVLIADIRDRGRQLVRTLDLSAEIFELKFLSENELLLTTFWRVTNTDAQLLQRAAGQVHTLCSPTFGVANVKAGNPRALAVDTKSKLVAVALRDEVRVFRYAHNPHGRWAGVRDCVDD